MPAYPSQDEAPATGREQAGAARKPRSFLNERGILLFTSNHPLTDSDVRRPHFPFELLSPPRQERRAVGFRTLTYKCNTVITGMQGEVRSAVLRALQHVWGQDGDAPEVNFLPQSGRTRITFVDVVFRQSAQFQQVVNTRNGLPVISVPRGRNASEARPIQLHPVVHGMDFGPDIFVMQVAGMPESGPALGQFRATMETVAELLDLWKVVQDDSSVGTRGADTRTFIAVGRLHAEGAGYGAEDGAEDDAEGGGEDGGEDSAEASSEYNAQDSAEANSEYNAQDNAEDSSEYHAQYGSGYAAVVDLPGWLVVDSHGSTPRQGYMLSYIGRQPWCNFCNWRDTRHARHLSKDCPYDEAHQRAVGRNRRERRHVERKTGADSKARSNVRRSAVARTSEDPLEEADELMDVDNHTLGRLRIATFNIDGFNAHTSAFEDPWLRECDAILLQECKLRPNAFVHSDDAVAIQPGMRSQRYMQRDTGIILVRGDDWLVTSHIYDPEMRFVILDCLWQKRARITLASIHAHQRSEKGAVKAELWQRLQQGLQGLLDNPPTNLADVPHLVVLGGDWNHIWFEADTSAAFSQAGQGASDADTRPALTRPTSTRPTITRPTITRLAALARGRLDAYFSTLACKIQYECTSPMATCGPELTSQITASK